jgi:hypothetical protein
MYVLKSMITHGFCANPNNNFFPDEFQDHKNYRHWRAFLQKMKSSFANYGCPIRANKLPFSS